MLVSLPAFLAAELRAIALPAFLDQRLAVARPPHAGLLKDLSPSSDRSFWSSSMALSWMPVTAPLGPRTNLCVVRLAGGEGRLPTRAERATPRVGYCVLRREYGGDGQGRGMAMSPASVRAAATAATLADGFVMLLRRVTRWPALSELDRIECELVRECDCLGAADDELIDMDGAVGERP